MSRIDEILEQIKQIDDYIQNWDARERRLQKNAASHGSAPLPGNTLLDSSEKTHLEQDKEKLTETLIIELEAKYLRGKIQGEFLEFEKEDDGYKLHYLDSSGHRGWVRNQKDPPNQELAALQQIHELTKELESESEDKERAKLLGKIESFTILAYWPKMYIAYLRGGKEALRDFFETGNDGQSKDKSSKHGKLKERVEQLAKRDGCKPGATVPSAKIQKWVRELKTEGITTKESSVRTILQRLGYTKERKLE